MAGIPTVLITTDPASSAPMRPPRAIHPVGHSLGHSLGRAGQRDLHLAVLRAALGQLEALRGPGEVVDMAFRAPAAR